MSFFSFLGSCFGYSESTTSIQDESSDEFLCMEAVAVSERLKNAQPDISGESSIPPSSSSSGPLNSPCRLDSCMALSDDGKRPLYTSCSSSLMKAGIHSPRPPPALVTRAVVGVHVPRGSTKVYIRDLPSCTIVPAGLSMQFKIISIPWISRTEKVNGRLFIQGVLIYTKSGFVYYLDELHVDKQVRKVLCRSGYSEEVEKWERVRFVAAHFGDFDRQVVPEEADRQRLLDGEGLPLDPTRP